MAKYEVYCDGGARGNPGPAAIGVVIKKMGGKMGSAEDEVVKIGKFVGSHLTNNQAEYLAVLEALKKLHRLNASRIVFHLDSELVVKQLNGSYKVKNPQLKKLHQQIQTILRNFKVVEFRHVTRGNNQEADSLVNEVLDKLSYF